LWQAIPQLYGFYFAQFRPNNSDSGYIEEAELNPRYSESDTLTTKPYCPSDGGDESPIAFNVRELVSWRIIGQNKTSESPFKFTCNFKLALVAIPFNLDGRDRATFRELLFLLCHVVDRQTILDGLMFDVLLAQRQEREQFLQCLMKYPK
jgi:hypothetical protein